MKRRSTPSSSGKCKSKSQGAITPHLLGWPLLTSQMIASLGKDVEKRESLYPVSGDVN